MMPEGREPRHTAPSPPSVDEVGPVAVVPPSYRWYHKFSAILLIALCAEIGAFLFFFPWTEYWETNYFSTLIPEWRH
jgi:hypothetical protein